MKDLVGNNIKVGDLCYCLKAGTSVRVCIVEILEFNNNGAICEVINNNPSDLITRGVYWENGHITIPLAVTKLIRCNVTL